MKCGALAVFLALTMGWSSRAASAPDIDTALDRTVDATGRDLGAPKGGWVVSSDTIILPASLRALNDLISKVSELRASGTLAPTEAEVPKFQRISLSGIALAFAGDGDFRWEILRPYYFLEIASGIQGPVFRFLRRNPTYIEKAKVGYSRQNPYRGYFNTPGALEPAVLDVSALCTADPASFVTATAARGYARPAFNADAIERLENDHGVYLGFQNSPARIKLLVDELRRIDRECWKD
jgi:hypothetical protein